MTETYWITGVEIGMILALLDVGKNNKIEDLLEEILEHRLVSNDVRRMEGDEK